MAAQFGRGAAAQHVPGLELRGAPARRLMGPVGPLLGGDHMDQRVALVDARAGRDFPDGVAASQGGAHQLALAQRGGVRVVHIAALEHVDRQAPGGERQFVDGRVDRLFAHPRRQVAGGGPAKAGEARHKARSVDVDVVRPAVVAEAPADLQPQRARGLQARQQGTEVELAVALHHAPADRFAHRADAELRQHGVVGVGALLVAGGRVHVERLAQVVDVVGPFVAGLPEAGERLGRWIVHGGPHCGRLRVAALICSSGSLGLRSICSRPFDSWKVSANWV